MSNWFTRSAFRRGYRKALNDLVMATGHDKLAADQAGTPWTTAEDCGKSLIAHERGLRDESFDGKRDAEW